MDQLRQVAPAIVAIDEHRHEEGPNAGDGARLDRGEDSAENAAEDDRQCHEPPEGIDGDLDRLAQRHGLAARVAVAVGEHQAQHDEGGAEQQARHDPGHKKTDDGDRAPSSERIDDGVMARRHEQCLHRGADRHIRREDARIAGPLHLRDHHRTDRRGVGDCRTGYAAQERRGEHIDGREPAANADQSDQDIGKGHQAARHPALGHDRTGQHKERDRQHGELADPARHLQHHRLERDADPVGAGKRSKAERVGDRHAQSKAGEEGPDDDQDFHLTTVRSASVQRRRTAM